MQASSQTFGISKYLKNQYINPQGNWSLAFRFGYFHTISAINNAGFDIISNRSIMPYYLNYGLQIWIIVLLVIGGIGYPTIYDFHKFLKRKLWTTKRNITFLCFQKFL
ncbi:potassium transporter TrkG [Mycoplasmopsis felis]|uniref:potassium transporter TrkG n=1 Tax=Mycoplasmopsis felis TaxID=33923 RepID=UPI003A5C7FA0